MTFLLPIERDTSTGRARIGFIGFGAIAREAVVLLTAMRPRTECMALVRDPARAAAPANVRLVTTVEELLQAEPHVIAETAGHEAVSALVPLIAAHGVPVVIASVGALADPAVMQALIDSGAAAQNRIYIPAGAVGGLDYLRALRGVPDATVIYVSRKPPAAWESDLKIRGIDPHALAEECVLFEGTAREAATKFPRNLNVAMTIALAGVGVERTMVRVVADPRARGNTHEVIAQSALGSAELRFTNFASPSNSRTSLVTAHSIVLSIHEALQAGSSVAAVNRTCRSQHS